METTDTLVIVTGGSAGLGRALLASAPPGAHRVDVSRRGTDLADTVHLAADLTDPVSWAQVGERLTALVTRGAWERVTLLHNAGTLEPIGFAGEVDAEAYTRNVLLNSAAGQVLGHRFLAAVRDLGIRRELVLISSGAARSAYPGWSAYGAGKAATDQWVRTVGAEQAQRGGVLVLSVAPGVVATGMQELIRDTDPRDFPSVDRFHDLYARGQLVEADVAAEALWALLDDPGVTSGEVVDLRSR
jgi:benzil reductase ((S)-benzoin forming)